VSSNGSVSGRLARVGALLERCVTAVTGIAAAAFLWLVVAPALWPTERKEALTALASVRLPLTGSALRGSANAKVALVEFSDFQCPFCVKFEQEIMPTLSREYIETGKVLLVFRHYPQSTLHPQAFAAAEFAECAGRQGQFWPFHSLLTASRGNLETESLSARGTSAHFSTASSRSHGSVGEGERKHVIGWVVEHGGDVSGGSIPHRQ
jgi:protein-disulfide isomerase